jgi:hypothetical protein
LFTEKVIVYFLFVYREGYCLFCVCLQRRLLVIFCLFTEKVIGYFLFVYREGYWLFSVCLQRAIEESRWRELEMTQERAARLVGDGAMKSHSASRLATSSAIMAS